MLTLAVGEKKTRGKVSGMVSRTRWITLSFATQDKVVYMAGVE